MSSEKNIMRTSLFLSIIIGCFFLLSCEKEKTDLFKKEYFYYTFNFEKIPLYLYLSEVYIQFNHSLTKEETKKFIDKYTFINNNQTSPRINTENKNLKCIINAKDTIQLVSLLKVLNQDTISYAVPVFTMINNDPKTYCIPINEILCDPLISEPELIKIISKYNLTIIKSKPEHLYYKLKINEIIAGFEPLKIANSLNETGNFNYCCPNIIAAGGVIKGILTKNN